MTANASLSAASTSFYSDQSVGEALRAPDRGNVLVVGGEVRSAGETQGREFVMDAIASGPEAGVAPGSEENSRWHGI